MEHRVLRLVMTVIISILIGWPIVKKRFDKKAEYLRSNISKEEEVLFHKFGIRKLSIEEITGYFLMTDKYFIFYSHESSSVDDNKSNVRISVKSIVSIKKQGIMVR